MKIKRKPMSFHNVLSISQTVKTGKWYGLALALREYMIKNELYPTGPVFYQTVARDEETTLYTVYMPLQAPAELEEGSSFEFLAELSFEEGLLFRHPDIDESIELSYRVLETCAKVNKLHLQPPFFNLYLDVYGDGVIDIYAPIKKGETSDCLL